MEKYEVKIKDRNETGVLDNQVWLRSRRSLFFDADNFAHAEEQAEQCLESDEEIYEIVKDYTNVET